MTIEQFRSTLAEHEANPGWPPALRAMWEDAKGNWNAAHAIAQESDGKTGSWIHAYLHRKEGDLANAGYWYRRAGQSMEDGPLTAEWDRIVLSILGAGAAVLDDK